MFKVGMVVKLSKAGLSADGLGGNKEYPWHRPTVVGPDTRGTVVSINGRMLTVDVHGWITNTWDEKFWEPQL